MIQARNLTRRFGGFTAVDDLSFDVPAGAICAFLGANGAGKSTTVKMLAGLLAPTSGTATVAGLDAANQPVDLKRRIGVLPENLGLFEDLTVQEHLELTGRVYGLTAAETATRIEELLDALSLAHGRHRFAGQCSQGMKKKTALAMAILPNPAVLFLDEPFEAIDPVTSHTMRDLFRTAAARGVTLFLTSHILSTVEDIATQILILRGGRLVWNSPADELPKDLESLYFELAEPPKNVSLSWLGVPPE
jgi:ABC-2 type transport system ATP-binding protein